jgi:quercetin dioxygenase-like cupin family protein
MTEDLDRAVTGGLVPAGHGRELATGTTRPTVKVGPHSGSRLIGMLESDVPPGGAFPGHVHDDYEEVFYVLAGEIQYLIDNDWTNAPAGSTVFIPPGRVHAFRNVGDEPARHLAIASPAVAMTMIEELAQAEPQELPAVFARYRSRIAD